MPKDYKDLEMTKECELKQGYVGLVTDVYKEPKRQYPILTARAVFAVLNKKSLSFFSKENINSLVKTVDISHMKPSYYPTAWKGLYCFQLVASNRVFLIENSLQRGDMALPSYDTMCSICLQSEGKMEEWTRAIQRFHNCIVKPAEDSQIKEKTEIDRLKGWYKVLKMRERTDLREDQEEDTEEDEHEIQLMKEYMKKFKEEVVQKKAEE